MPIIVPGTRTAESQVPEGVKHPQTYLKVAAVVNKVAAAEVAHGANPTFIKWKGKSQAFKQALQAQFRAYSAGLFPFNIPLSDNQPVREWWEQRQGMPEADILAVCLRSIYYVLVYC